MIIKIDFFFIFHYYKYMTKINNILLTQIRKNSFLREIVLKSQRRWGPNLTKILQTPYKKYEDRILEPTYKNIQIYTVNKKYEQRILQNSPSKPIKKYEQDEDDWDIEYIKKNGGL